MRKILDVLRLGFAAGITNCPVGVFAACWSRHGHAFIDRALCLPKAWADDAARRTAAHGPSEVAFATKPRIAVQAVGRAMAASVPFAQALSLCQTPRLRPTASAA